ncbi:MAG: vWA domain-containing protein [Pirellulaceae bacterium]
MRIPNRPTRNRRGAVAPLMALLFPVILLVCGVCVNIAYMQLNKTELRVATDSAARAAGRAFSEFQDIDVAISYAVSTGQLNNIGSEPLRIHPAESYGEIEFGTSNRLNNGYGRYEFIPQDRTEVRNKTARATAIRIMGRRTTDSIGGTIQMLFSGFGPFSEFSPVAASTSTQVDRDIALVLDRSGSMLEYKNFSSLYDQTYDLYYDGIISSKQRNKALGWVGNRRYPYSYTPGYEDFHHLNNRGFVEEWQYAYDMDERRPGWGNQYSSNQPAPRHSRWHQLDIAVNAFLDVLEDTDQDERVAMISFSGSATKDLPLVSTYNPIRTKVGQVSPKNGTNIGSGMQLGLDSIIYGAANPDSRPYAAKTIVVLTDGQHEHGNYPLSTPISTANSLVASHNVIIHTVTFSTSVPQSSKDEMGTVATIGGGKHYHADTGAELVDVFEEIANNLPTIITE